MRVFDKSTLTPIERTMCDALANWLVVQSDWLHLEMPWECKTDTPCLGLTLWDAYDTKRLTWGIYPQQPIGPYRPDFMLQIISYAEDGIFDAKGSAAIECDGHDFHKSPKQKAYDDKKNRYFQALGMPMVRFSGRQIYRYSDDLAMQAWNMCRLSLQRNLALSLIASGRQTFSEAMPIVYNLEMEVAAHILEEQAPRDNQQCLSFSKPN